MDIIYLIRDLILHMVYFAVFFTTATILGFIILFMVMWDCLIFIVKNIGDFLCQNKQ